MNPGRISITQKKGIHMLFPSGFTVSIQFGPGNYCDHYKRRIGKDEETCGEEGAAEVECAIWKDEGMITMKDGDTVQGYMSITEVLELLNQAAKGEFNEQFQIRGI